MADVTINSESANIPGVMLTDQGSDPAEPSAGYSIMYTKSGKVYVRSTSGIWTPAANPMTTQGDLIFGGASGVPTRLGKGTATQLLAMNAGETAPEWIDKPAAGSGLFDAYVHVQDQKSAGTNGGTATSGSWETRNLNTEQADTAAIASVASNQITLPAGTYVCDITVPGYKVGVHRAALYNTTSAAYLLYGTSHYTINTDSVSQDSRITGLFVLAAESVLEVRHNVQVTQATTGHGVAVNQGGNEVYTDAQFWRVTA